MPRQKKCGLDSEKKTGHKPIVARNDFSSNNSPPRVAVAPQGHFSAPDSRKSAPAGRPLREEIGVASIPSFLFVPLRAPSWTILFCIEVYWRHQRSGL
jgi:hypothetical protein